MSKYIISYTTEDWWEMEVDADSQEDAYDKFMSGEYNHSDATLTEGEYLQDSIDISEA